MNYTCLFYVSLEILLKECLNFSNADDSIIKQNNCRAEV